MAVAEACRNVACTGALPLGITNCLNFGNPYKPEMYWTFSEAVRGMGEACRVLDTPVTGGNVSFYNESPVSAVFPTPTIGVVGLVEDAEKTVGMEIKNPGEAIYLLGNNKVSWAGSELQMMQSELPSGTLAELDLEFEHKLQACIIEAIHSGMVSAVHDLAEGGLIIALAEMIVANRENHVGAMIEFEDPPTPLELFGEGPSRILAVVKTDQIDEFESLAKQHKIPAEWMGTTGGNGLGVRTIFSVGIDELKDAYWNGLEKSLGLKEM